RMVRILLRMLSAIVDSAKVSAQSPPWSRNASPRDALASCSRSLSASPAKTRGGEAASCSVTARSSSTSRHSGCWEAGSSRHLSNPRRTAGSASILTPARIREVRNVERRRSAPWETGGRRRPGQVRSVLHGVGRGDVLADARHELGEPRLGDVEGLATGDPRERDRRQLPAVLLVVPDDAGDVGQRAVHGLVDHRADELEVALVRRGGAGEVAGLLHHDLLRADELGELLAEPLAGVDRVELDMAEGVTLDLLALGLELGDDLRHTGTLGEEDVDVPQLVHDAPQALGLALQVDLHLGQEDGVDVPALL